MKDIGCSFSHIDLILQLDKRDVLHGQCCHIKGYNVLAGADITEEIGALRIADLRESEAVPADEIVERCGVAIPGHPDDIDLALPTLRCLLDRAGFVITHASSRCPEPERGGYSHTTGPGERCATHERGFELQARRHRCSR